jgi:quercetin dioxygenase-like cupin family protein
MATILDLNDPDRVRNEIDLLGPRVEFLIRPTDGGVAALRGTIPAAGFVPLHSHADIEAFYMITGQMQLYSEKANAWLTVKPGQFVFIPGNEKHAWRNTSSEDATSLLITTANLGSFFDAIGLAISDDTSLSPPTPERFQQYIETELKYGYWSGTREENAAIGIIF